MRSMPSRDEIDPEPEASSNKRMKLDRPPEEQSDGSPNRGSRDSPEEAPRHDFLEASTAERFHHHGAPHPPEASPSRYSAYAPEQRGEPSVAGSTDLLRRIQRDLDNPYAIGHGGYGLPPLGGANRLSPRQELLLLQQEQQRQIEQQRPLGIFPDQMRATSLRGGDPSFLPPARGALPMSSLSSAALPPRASLYGEQPFGDQSPLRQQLSRESQLLDRGRGLGGLVNPSLTQRLPAYPYGPLTSASSDYLSGSAMLGPTSEFTRMSSQLRGVDPLSRPEYQNLLLANPGSYSDQLNTATDALLAEHYPATAAALGRGLGQSQQHLGGGSLTQHPTSLDLLPSAPPNPTAIALYLPSDEEALSQYQCVVRKQIEIFAALPIDVDTNAQGRNKPIVLGQVGIRCRHCSLVHPKRRARGGTYYPSRLSGFYQAAQNMATVHLCEFCTYVPHPLRRQLLILRERKSSAGGGKDYWADSVKVLGIIEDKENNILRFATKDEKQTDEAKDDMGDHEAKDDIGDDEAKDGIGEHSIERD